MILWRRNQVKAKSILRTLLMVFVVVSGVFLVIKEVRQRSESGSVSDPSNALAAMLQRLRSEDSVGG